MRCGEQDGPQGVRLLPFENDDQHTRFPIDVKRILKAFLT